MRPRCWLLLLAAVGGCSKKAVLSTPPPAASPTATSKAAADPAPRPSDTVTRTSGDAASLRRTIETRIHFEYDRWELTPQAKAILRDKAVVLVAHPTVAVRIEGHADERGSDEYNLVLSSRRAAEAKRLLIELGVDPSRLVVLGLGEEQPLDPASHEAAWASNRRAEFRISAGSPEPE